MTKPVRFDPDSETIALTRELDASVGPARPDPPVPVDGVTIGVATMRENAPHGGEMHPDGDEILYLIEGRISVSLETTPPAVLELDAGEGIVVPKGVWHRVDIVSPSRIVYITPGPNGQYRPLPAD